MIPIYRFTIVMVAWSLLLSQVARAAPAQAPNAVPRLVEWADPMEDQRRDTLARADAGSRFCDGGESGRQDPHVPG